MQKISGFSVPSRANATLKKQFLRKNRLSLKLDAQSALGKVVVINRSITRNKMRKLYWPFVMPLEYILVPLFNSNSKLAPRKEVVDNSASLLSQK